MTQDADLIESLGGASKVAARFGYSVQRVHNWIARGIPAAEKLKHREVLLDGEVTPPKPAPKRRRARKDAQQFTAGV